AKTRPSEGPRAARQPDGRTAGTDERWACGPGPSVRGRWRGAAAWEGRRGTAPGSGRAALAEHGDAGRRQPRVTGHELAEGVAVRAELGAERGPRGAQFEVVGPGRAGDLAEACGGGLGDGAAERGELGR